MQYKKMIKHVRPGGLVNKEKFIINEVSCYINQTKYIFVRDMILMGELNIKLI